MSASPEITKAIHEGLAARGYAYISEFSADTSGHDVVAAAAALGELYIPNALPGGCAFIDTAPRPDAVIDAPFDRAEAIGWHSDFSTHRERPELSFAHLVRVDPGGPERGAWRVASVHRVLERLRSGPRGADTFARLADTALPFAFTDQDEPTLFHVLVQRDGGWGLRFYPRAIRTGFRKSLGLVPDEIEEALAELAAAADAVGSLIRPKSGSLLVVDNWRALHDRTEQTVESSLPLRRSLLCFVLRRS